MVAAALYVGETTHHRFAPRPHSFRYRLFQVLVDIDSPADGLPSLMRIGRHGLFSFTPRDHGDRSGAPLRAWVEARLAETGLRVSAAHIRLLAFPRILGFVFNPLSLFFVEDAAGRLEAVIYEVNNTFGQTHAYVIPAEGSGRQSQTAAKQLYVSPFYKVEGDYRFEIGAPTDTFRLTILKSLNGRPDFSAAQTARREPLSNARLIGLFVSMPLMTLKVVAAIHWEAVRLLFKGALFGARPPGPKAGASLGQALVRASETGLNVSELGRSVEDGNDRHPDLSTHGASDLGDSTNQRAKVLSRRSPTLS